MKRSLLCALLSFSIYLISASEDVTIRFANAIANADETTVQEIINDCPHMVDIQRGFLSACHYGDSLEEITNITYTQRESIIRLLVEKGADVNYQNKENGNTVLHGALGHNMYDVINNRLVRTLLSFPGIQLSLRNKNGQTPLGNYGADVDGDDVIRRKMLHIAANENVRYCRDNDGDVVDQQRYLE